MTKSCKFSTSQYSIVVNWPCGLIIVPEWEHITIVLRVHSKLSPVSGMLEFSGLMLRLLVYSKMTIIHIIEYFTVTKLNTAIPIQINVHSSCIPSSIVVYSVVSKLNTTCHSHINKYSLLFRTKLYCFI